MTAIFNAASERIDFAYNTSGSAGVINLQADSSNFLAATKLDSANVVAGIDPDNVRALDQVAALKVLENRSSSTVGRGFSRVRSYRIAHSFADVFADLNAVFKGSASVNAPLTFALKDAFGDNFGTETFGLLFEDSIEARRRGSFATMNRRKLTADLQQRGDAVSSFLADREGQAGFVNGLLQATRQALSSVNSTLNIRDTLIDTFA